MKLLLTSEGITNSSIANALSELLGKPYKISHAVHVPTAANEETGDKGWVTTQINGIRNLGFLSADVVDISKNAIEVWLSVFDKADVIVFGGGNSSYLLKWLRKSGLALELPRLLKNRVYLGISAGSMVTAKIVSLTAEGLLYYEKTGNLGEAKGLGLVDFEIRPHLNDPYFSNVRVDFLEKLATKTPRPFYAIDDQTAIKVDGDKVSIVSEGKWKKFNSLPRKI